MSRDIRIPLFATIIFFFVLFLYTRLAGPIPFSFNVIQTTKTNLFSVSGTGKVNTIPDTAVISAGVTSNATTVDSAKNQSDTVINNIVAELKKLGIDEKNIKTTEYNVVPEYNNIDYSFDGTPITEGRIVPPYITPVLSQKIIGYTVTQNLQVKVKPIDKANKAVDVITANGGNIVNQISFTIDDNVRKNLENKAREDAIKDAKSKAEKLASAAGMNLVKVVDVQESYYPRYGYGGGGGNDVAKAEAPAPTELNPGETAIEITVTLFYETR
ncbi:MAG: SIMPL domain-containing protein [Patescibacteria group bacterium]|nr:SIMPL domain-containing protein [Patescibacteria group bacterium]